VHRRNLYRLDRSCRSFIPRHLRQESEFVEGQVPHVVVAHSLTLGRLGPPCEAQRPLEDASLIDCEEDRTLRAVLVGMLMDSDSLT
jgi:hypothetical protein